jgi:hypothetical protein
MGVQHQCPLVHFLLGIKDLSHDPVSFCDLKILVARGTKLHHLFDFVAPFGLKSIKES